MSNKKHYYCNGIRWRPDIGRTGSSTGYNECGTPSKKFIIRHSKILGFCERCAPNNINEDDEIMGQMEARVAEVMYG